MTYLKSVLFGVGGAMLAAVLWITVKFILPMFLPYMISRIRQTGGASGASITSDSIWIAALVGFVTAFEWEWHRLRRVTYLRTEDQRLPAHCADSRGGSSRATDPD